MATQMQARNEQFNILNTLKFLFFKPLSTFLKIYFRHRGYIDGMPGFIFALFSGLTHAVAYIKYWQRRVAPSGGSATNADQKGNPDRNYYESRLRHQVTHRRQRSKGCRFLRNEIVTQAQRNIPRNLALKYWKSILTMNYQLITMN